MRSRNIMTGEGSRREGQDVAGKRGKEEGRRQRQRITTTALLMVRHPRLERRERRRVEKLIDHNLNFSPRSGAQRKQQERACLSGIETCSEPRLQAPQEREREKYHGVRSCCSSHDLFFETSTDSHDALPNATLLLLKKKGGTALSVQRWACTR